MFWDNKDIRHFSIYSYVGGGNIQYPEIRGNDIDFVGVSSSNGVQIVTSPTGVITNPKITMNTITNACQSTGSAGIYLDSVEQGDSIEIIKNTINGSGVDAVEARYFKDGIIKDNVFTRPIDFLRVKGRKTPEKVFELIEFKNSQTIKIYNEFIEYYNNAFQLYTERKYIKALNFLKKANNIIPNDTVLKQLEIKCKNFIEPNVQHILL